MELHKLEIKITSKINHNKSSQYIKIQNMLNFIRIWYNKKKDIEKLNKIGKEELMK